MAYASAAGAQWAWGGGGGREASMSQGFRKETLHRPIPGRLGGEAVFQSQRVETFLFNIIITGLITELDAE